MGAGDVLANFSVFILFTERMVMLYLIILCVVLMVDISIPQKPRFLPLFGSSLMSGA